MHIHTYAHTGDSSQHQPNVSATCSKLYSMNGLDQSVALWTKPQQRDTSVAESQFINFSAAPAMLC